MEIDRDEIDLRGLLRPGPARGLLRLPLRQAAFDQRHRLLVVAIDRRPAEGHDDRSEPGCRVEVGPVHFGVHRGIDDNDGQFGDPSPAHAFQGCVPAAGQNHHVQQVPQRQVVREAAVHEKNVRMLGGVPVSAVGFGQGRPVTGKNVRAAGRLQQERVARGHPVCVVLQDDRRKEQRDGGRGRHGARDRKATQIRTDQVELALGKLHRGGGADIRGVDDQIGTGGIRFREVTEGRAVKELFVVELRRQIAAPIAGRQEAGGVERREEASI